MSANSNTLADAWLRLWSPTINLPGSGSLGFNYHPYTTWDAPSLFSGNQMVEAGIYREVASPGKQLNSIIDVVLELADALSKIDAHVSDSECVKKLRKLSNDIETVKGRVEESAAKQAEKILDELLANDPDALKLLLEKYHFEK